MTRITYRVTTISPNQSLIYCGRFVGEKDARDKYAEQLAVHPDCEVYLCQEEHESNGTDSGC